MSNGASSHKVGFALTKEALTDSAQANGATSLVDRIFAMIAGAIHMGRVTAGARLPSVRQLADDCEISRDTAARAYDKLVAHGLVESRRGSGYYAKASVPKRAPEPTVSRPSLFHPNGLAPISKFLFSMNRPDHGLTSRSGSGVLPESWVDESAIAGAIRAVARGSQRSIAHYGDPQGYLPLRQQLQLKLQSLGLGIDASNLIVTGGAAEAINLVITAFMRSPCPSVLIERPCQPLLVDRLMSAGINCLHVPREHEGPDLTVLREHCVAHQPRYFICNSSLHNPTGSQMAPHKAFQLLRLAEEFNLTIVEDDSYGDLLSPTGTSGGTRLAPLDQLERVIYIGSFSKTLAAGLRVGYIAASSERAEWLSVYRTVGCIATNNLAERTVYRLLSEGNYRHHCEQLRARLADSRPRVAETLRSMGVKFEHMPESGLFLWGDLGEGIDAFALARRMLDKGHLTAPGVLFSAEATSQMRFNVASTLEAGFLETLGHELSKAREHARS